MRHFYRLIILTMVILAGVSVEATQAQDTTCPTNVELSFARASSACASVGQDEACYGAGAVVGETFDELNVLAQPGDTTSLIDLREISTSLVEGTWSTAMLNMRASFDRAQRRNIVAWLFGDTTVTNETIPSPEVTSLTIGTAILRDHPSEAGSELSTVPVNTELTVNGRSADGLWFRVFVPNLNAVGWVATSTLPFVDFLDLSVADPEAGYPRPFQFLTLSTAASNAPCPDETQSGMILQSPASSDIILFLVNDVVFRLAGTAFLQTPSPETLSISMIDGYAEVRTSEADFIYLPSGAKTVIGLDESGSAPDQPVAAEPYDPTILTGLPLTNLPFRVRELPQAMTSEQIASFSSELIASQTIRPVAEPTLDTSCRRAMARPDDLRAGPGTFYEVSGGLMRGATLTLVLQARDADGATWYQISSGPWVAASSITESGICRAVPVSNTAPPPSTNQLIMETCESTNGPLRGGQRVTIEFTPPTWETLGEAIIAPRIDPGRIVVNGLLQSGYVGDPVRLTPTSVSRTFYADWTATVGTHHISSERLSYSLICDLTVPAS